MRRPRLRLLAWLRRLDRWDVRWRVALVAAVVVLLSGLAAALPTIHVWARASAFTADVVLQLPVRPLTWVTGTPSTEEIRWEDRGRGLLTLPAGSEKVPALIVVLGADPAQPDDERVVRLTDGLARIGFAMLLYQSDELNEALVLPIEIERLAGAFETLAAHPRVRPEAIGYVGLSAGGSLAMVAASDAHIARDVAFVVAIGPYYDGASLAAQVMSRSFRGPDGIEEWDPDEIVRRAIRNTLLATLPEDERAAIEEEEREPRVPEGKAIAALLAMPSLEQAEELLAGLGPAQRELLEAISPSHALDGLRAPLYLLHDRNDEFIPWVESEALVAEHAPAVYHRLDLFEHVDPNPGNVRYLVSDGWRLLRLFVRIFEDTS